MVTVATVTSWLMLLLGLALMTAILLRRSFRYYRALRPNQVAGRSTCRASANRQPLSDAPPELLRWQVDMHETARGLKAELDSKIGVLQSLIGMAIKERERLEGAMREARNLGLRPLRDPLETIEALPDGSPDKAETMLAEWPATANTAYGELASPARRRRIYQLFDQGLMADAIAARLQMPLGEVEMILHHRAALVPSDDELSDEGPSDDPSGLA